jgi:uncharacterized protein YcnI
MLPINRGSISASAVALAFVAPAPLATPAVAHATLETAEASPDSTYRGVLRIPHGCKGEATHTVRITIPEGVIGAKPMPKAGWTITIRKGRYAKTYDYFGRPLSEGAQEIVWSNGTLSNDHYDEFVFSARLAPDLPVGGTIYFPVIQECANGSERWVDIPAPGQDAHSLPHPAPQVALVAQHMREAHERAAPQTYKAGDLVITAPWVRATPRGAPVAGGYLTITNNGREPDRLVGGSFAAAGRFEVHEMSMEGGVMRMRPVADGLEIKPGQTVELKPGGLHLMFMGLKEQLKAGDTVKGTLEFAKAGKVEVVYPVRSMGAGGGHKHH